MATHDYVIANGTGAAVRSDLNNALAAIVSNNSGSSEPGTTYAYQWWADTNANVLKIRNSANDAWITLRELDGTMLIEDGTNSAPGLAFADDTNTGIYSPAADQIGFVTAGVQRLVIETGEVVFNDPSNDVDFRVESNGNTHMLFVDAGNDRVGIGESSPDRKLHINSGATDTALKVESTDSEVSIELTDNAGSAFIGGGGNYLNFYAGGNERARIDSSGRLLVGTSSNIGSGADNRDTIIGVSASGAGLLLGRNDTSTAEGNNLGKILFYGNDSDGTYEQCASIQAQADLAHGTGDKPTRLVFSTTADGASSTTERLRIDSSGNVGIGNSSPGSILHIRKDSTNNSPLSHNYPASQSGLFIDNQQTGTTGAFSAVTLRAYNSDSVAQAASIIAQSVAGSGLAPSLLFTQRTSSGNNSERARIDSDGRFLIGTSSSVDSSNENLAVVSGGNTQISLARNDTSVASGNTLAQIKVFGNDDNGTYQECARIGFEADGNHATDDKPTRIAFEVTADGASSPTERIRINRFGGLNVGSSKLGVNTGDGNITVDDGIYISAYDGDYQIRGNSSGAGSATLYIGNAAIQVSSDRRLKENIVDTVVDAAEELKRVRVVDFTWNDPSDLSFNNRNARGTWTGLIAQELVDVFPFAVNAPRTEEDLSIDQDSEKRWLVDQDQLVPVLIKGFQQALARIETLEAKVAALEAG